MLPLVAVGKMIVIIHTIKNYILWPFSQTEFSIDICVYEFDYIMNVDA